MSDDDVEDIGEDTGEDVGGDAVEARLRRLLAARAAPVRSELTGASLRFDARERSDARPRRGGRVAAVVCAAAAVAAIATGTALVAEPHGGRPAAPGPVPAGATGNGSSGHGATGHGATAPVPSPTQTARPGSPAPASLVLVPPDGRSVPVRPRAASTTARPSGTASARVSLRESLTDSTAAARARRERARRSTAISSTASVSRTAPVSSPAPASSTAP